MTIEKLKKALKKARTKYRADKTDKEAKAAWKAAKKALSDAEAQADQNETTSNGKKRSLPDVDEGSPKKKSKVGPSIEELETAMKEAKAAWKASDSDKKLKAKFKKAKAALKEAKAQKENAEEPKVEEPKVDIAALKAAIKEARKVYKADKTNKEAKKKLKEAKAALAAAESAAAESNADEKESEATPMETTKEKVEDDFLAGLKAKKPVRTSDKPPSKVCWVGNLSFDVNDDAIKEFLKDCGTIENIRWLNHRDTGKFKGCGYITFDSIESATKAFNKGGEEFMGREFRVDYDKERAPPREQAPPSLRLFLGNVSFDADDEKLKEHFKDCGEIQDIYWVTDRDSGDFRGFGFCTFYDQESADKAYAMSGKDFCGRAMRVDYTHPKPSRSGGGGRGGGKTRPLSEKPDGCTTVFVGGLPDDIDDAKITEFFSDAGAISQIRWLTDRDSGEFKGAGFIEFEDPAASLDKAIAKNGCELNGRKVRVDYAKPRDR